MLSPGQNESGALPITPRAVRPASRTIDPLTWRWFGGLHRGAPARGLNFEFWFSLHITREFGKVLSNIFKKITFRFYDPILNNWGRIAGNAAANHCWCVQQAFNLGFKPSPNSR